MKGGLALLRRRDFGLLWTAGLISDIGDWLLLIGLPLYVLQVTGSSLVTAAVFIAGLLPTVLVGPVAGVLADRWDRRRTLVVTSLAQAALLLPLLVVHGRGQLWVVYLVIAAEAALAQLFDPAKNALLPSLVDRDQLVSANALVGLNLNLGRLLGSSLGGVVMVTAGLRGVVIGDTVSFLAGAALIAWMRACPAAPAPTAAAAGSVAAPDGFVRQWLDGLGVVWHARQLRWSMVISAVSAVAQGLFVVLFVVFVTRILHGDGAEVGLLRGVQGIGGVLGGVLVGALGARLSAARLLAWSMLAFGLLDLAMWNVPALTSAEPLYLGAFIAAGIVAVPVLSGLTTLIQTGVADAYLGRVFGTFVTTFNGFQALGMLLGGLLADPIGVVPVLNGQAVLYLLCGVIAPLTLRPPERTVPARQVVAAGGVVDHSS
jgi:predicted MFS family arabinose efflux permease